MSLLLNLPHKLRARTFAYVNRASLNSLRQTCRLTSQLSTDQLYKNPHLYPDEKSQDAIRGILNNPNLQQIPRKIYVNTVEADYEYEEEEEQSFPKGWDELLPQLKGFPHLNSAVLRFDRNFNSDNSNCYHYFEHPQSQKFRFRTMDAFFLLLTSLQNPVLDLGIRNLQVDNPRDPETLANMAKALRGLRSLCLSIISEHNEAAPEHDLEFPEIRQFFSELPSAWLNPTTPSLQHLSLYAREYFGFYPQLDLSTLHFPRLKTLSLGNFCFFHDSQINWILAHGDTLEEIYLDDCAILYDFGMMGENVDQCGIPKNTLALREDDIDTWYGSYGKRWHDFFDLFAEKLPKLRHFRVGSTDWMQDVPFEQERDIKVGLFRNRYLRCYDGWGPSPYMYGEDDGEPSWRLRPECDDEDRAALRRLLAKIGQSVEENYQMRFSRVENLIESRRGY